MQTSPVAVPCVRLAHGGASLHTDRCHSLRSLPLPPAALPSLHLPVYAALLAASRALWATLPYGVIPSVVEESLDDYRCSGFVRSLHALRLVGMTGASVRCDGPSRTPVPTMGGAGANQVLSTGRGTRPLQGRKAEGFGGNILIYSRYMLK